MERASTAFEQAIMAFDQNNLRMAIRFLLLDRQQLNDRILKLEYANVAQQGLASIPSQYDGAQEVSFVDGLEEDTNVLNPDNHLK